MSYSIGIIVYRKRVLFRKEESQCFLALLYNRRWEPRKRRYMYTDVIKLSFSLSARQEVRQSRYLHGNNFRVKKKKRMSEFSKQNRRVRKKKIYKVFKHKRPLFRSKYMYVCVCMYIYLYSYIMCFFIINSILVPWSIKEVIISV